MAALCHFNIFWSCTASTRDAFYTCQISALIVYVLYIELSRELSFYVDEDVIEGLDYTEVDLVGDLSDTIRIEDKILFTVSVKCYYLYSSCSQ